MWYQTRATKRLNIEYPILSGPFGGGLSTVELTAIVSNMGGLGGFGAYTLSPQEIVDVDRRLRAATDKPYNLNLWVSDMDTPNGEVTDAQYAEAKTFFEPYFEEVGIPFPSKPPKFSSRFDNQFQAVLDIRPPVFSFMFGLLSPDQMEQCRKRGIILAGAATTLDEALALEATGVDIIIASGFEAGGHRPSFLQSAEASMTGTFVLVQLIRESTSTPVIAAGGIASGRGVMGALTLGADGVQVGTAFLACQESGALPVHRDMLFSDQAKHTMLSRAFTGRLGRGIRSRVAMDMVDKRPNLPFPLQTTLMSSLRKAALAQQKWDMVLFWGGQIAPILKHRKAADLMRSLLEETTGLLG
jgi:nitronate monooxygenase